MHADLHQHLWTEAFVEALARRSAPPYVRRRAGVVELECAGEPRYAIDMAGERPARRAALVTDDRLDVAAIAISSPIGVEALPGDESRALVAAWLEGAFALPDQFVVWGPVSLDDPRSEDVDALLARGCIGISVPAGALAGPQRLYELEPVLRRASQLGTPLLVHPGRAPGQDPESVATEEPAWWRPLTDYVWQMQAAWYTFMASGRAQFPDLRVVWTMLAGGAPLMHERFTARGGPALELSDPNSFYETSSYGPDAVSMTAALVGESQLVYGSDRPVVIPRIGQRDRRHQLTGANLIQKGAI